MQEAGFPPGVVNIVTGRGSVIGDALANHKDVNKLAITGSTEVGRSVIRASAGNLKRLALELGSKAPNIIFADADLDTAVPGAFMAAFHNTGQSCVAGSRYYVQAPIFDEVVSKLTTWLPKQKSAMPWTRKLNWVLLSTKANLRASTNYIESGKKQGGKLSLWRRTVEGWYL